MIKGSQKRFTDFVAIEYPIPVVHLANIHFDTIYLSVQNKQIQVLNHS
jgi:hypothetical protein